jgi:PAS domain S-box-containing protein
MKQAVGRRGKELQGPQELLAMREYSEALVSKLEEINLEYTEANKTLEERTALAEFNAEIAGALTHKGLLPKILHLCTEAMVHRLNAAFARIWTYNQKDHVLELQASAGMYTHLNGGHARVPVGQFKIGLIASERKPHLTNCVIGDGRVNDQEWAKREGMIAFAGYPLIVEERLVGVMAMFAKKPLSQNTLDAMASVANGIAAGIERKVTEDELRQSEERFRELAENINEVFFSTNADGSALHYVSPAYEHVFGRKKESLYQNPHDWLDAVHPDDRPRVEQSNQSHPEAFNDEYRIVRPDGQQRWIHARTFPVKNSAGKLVRSVGLGRRYHGAKTSRRKHSA